MEKYFNSDGGNYTFLNFGERKSLTRDSSCHWGAIEVQELLCQSLRYLGTLAGLFIQNWNLHLASHQVRGNSCMRNIVLGSK